MESEGHLQLMIVNHGEDGWRYLEYHPVAFVVDGERLAFNPKHEGTVGKGYVLEYLFIHLTKTQFLKFVNAKSIEAKVGRDEFALTADQLLALRDFASYIGTPTLRVAPSEVRSQLQRAIDLEAKNQEDVSRGIYEEIVDSARGTTEAREAARRLKRINDPAFLEAKRKAEVAKALARKQEEMVKALARKQEEMVKALARKQEEDRAEETRRKADEVKALARKKSEEKILRSKIVERMRLARVLDGKNSKGAATYYKEIVELSKDLSPEPSEAKDARARLKALGVHK